MDNNVANSDPAEGSREVVERELKRQEVSDKAPNAAQERGEIDKGKSGDKASGIDPAAAPMETDAEAGGASPTTAEVEQALRNERRRPTQTDNEADPDKTPDAGD